MDGFSEAQRQPSDELTLRADRSRVRVKKRKPFRHQVKNIMIQLAKKISWANDRREEFL